MLSCAAPPARMGELWGGRRLRFPATGPGGGVGASGNGELGSGLSGCPLCHLETWMSPEPRLRIGASALAMAGPAQVRVPRGQGSGRAGAVRRAAGPAAGPQQSRVRGAVACTAASGGFTAFSHPQSKRFGVEGFLRFAASCGFAVS